LPHLDKVMCHAPVVKLVDALDSKSSSERNAGSSPARGTIYLKLIVDAINIIFISRPPKYWF
jgi:hypothetical protein